MEASILYLKEKKMAKHNFRELKIWHLGIGFCKEILHQTKSFPKSETYGLISKINRACISIPSNIAEGSSRESNKEFDHFPDISPGSCFEVETQIEIAISLNYIEPIIAENLKINFRN